MMLQFQSLFGIFALLAAAWITSENRGGVPWRQAATGLGVTLATAALLLELPGTARAFGAINDAANAIAAAIPRAGPSPTACGLAVGPR